MNNDIIIIIIPQVPGRKYTYKFNLSGILQSGRKSFGGDIGQSSTPFVSAPSPYPMQRCDPPQQPAHDFAHVRQKFVSDNGQMWSNGGFLAPTLQNVPDAILYWTIESSKNVPCVCNILVYIFRSAILYIYISGPASAVPSPETTVKFAGKICSSTLLTEDRRW